MLHTELIKKANLTWEITYNVNLEVQKSVKINKHKCNAVAEKPMSEANQLYRRFNEKNIRDVH